MRSVAPLLTLSLLLVSLAGCLGSPAQTSGAPENDSPAVVEDPGNYTYVDNASFQTGGHIHDYWDGRDEVIVLDETLPAASTWFGAPKPTATFRSEKGKTVPQGTEAVEVAVDWTEQAESIYDHVELWVQTASENQSTSYGEIQPGDTVTINSTNADNDLPHRQLSSWKFHFVVYPVVNQSTPLGNLRFLRFRGEVSMEVTAQRGLELPVFPAHPDQWGNRSRIELFSEEHATTYRGNPSGGWSCFRGCPVPVHSPYNGTIVPFSADVVEIRFSYEPRLAGTDMGVKYHPADTWEWTVLEPDETQDGDRIYRIPVEPGTGDSPYAIQSLWEIVPFPSSPQENGWVDGTYEISAYAVRDA